jgi:hypothetical protein
MAWSRFGQNKWIDADTFNRDYLDVLQTLMDTMRTMVGTTNPWTDDLNSKWIGEIRERKKEREKERKKNCLTLILKNILFQDCLQVRTLCFFPPFLSTHRPCNMNKNWNFRYFCPCFL